MHIVKSQREAGEDKDGCKAIEEGNRSVERSELWKSEKELLGVRKKRVISEESRL